MAQRVTANSRVGRPAPQKGGKAKPAPNVIGVAGQGPLLNSPVPVRSSRPKPQKQPAFKVPKQARNKPPSVVPPPPKPTRQQQQQAFLRSNTQSAAGKAVTRREVQSGQAMVDKQGKLHYVGPTSLKDTVGSNAANDISLGELGTRVAQNVVGPVLTQAAEQQSISPILNHPFEGGVEALGILPFGKAAKVADVADEIRTGLRSEKSAADIINSARQVAQHGKLPPDRVVNLGGYHATVPSPQTRSGRAVAGAFDKNTERQIVKRAAERGIHPQQALNELSQGSRFRHPLQHVASQHAQNLMGKTKLYDNPGESLVRTVAEANLPPDEAMAIKSVAKGVHPDVTLNANAARIAKREKQIATDTAKLTDPALTDEARKKLEAKIRENQGFVHNLRNDNVVLQAAKKHIEMVPAEKAGERFSLPGVTHTGERPVLKAGTDRASKALNEHWDNFVVVSRRAQQAELAQWHQAVDDYMAAGKTQQEAEKLASKDFLSPTSAAARIHQPGRLDLGATWRPGEDILPKGLQETRQQVVSLQKQLDASMAKDAAKVAKGSVPTQKIGFEGQRFMSTESRNLRGQLNRAENSLVSQEKAFETRNGYHPSTLYGTKSGIRGSEDFKGGLAYYPSTKDTAKFSPKSGQYASAGEVLPYQVKKEVRHGNTGFLQETGQESVDPMSALGRQAMARQGRVWGNQMLKDLRAVSMKGTLPINVKGEVDRTMVALRQTATIPPEVLQKAHAVLSGVLESGAANLSERDLHEASVELNQVIDEWLMPKSSQWANEEGHLGFIAKPLAQAIKDTRRVPPEELRGLITAYHNVNQVARDMMIYSKIGHSPARAASNVLMATLGGAGAKDFTKGLFLVTKLFKHNPEILRWMHHELGMGFYASYADAGIASKGVNALSKGLVKPVEMAADRWVRYGAYAAYAIKNYGDMPYSEWVKTFHNLMKADVGTSIAADARRIKELSRQASGEYDGLGTRQKALASFIFLYRWIRTATKWTARTIVNHPIKSAAVGGLTYQFGYKGSNPIYDRFNIMGHNVQTMVPWSTPVEELQRVESLTSSKPAPLGGAMGSIVNPVILDSLSTAFHRDLETGTAIKGNAILGGLEQFWKSTPPGALLQGKQPLENRILKFFLGNWAPSDTASPSTTQSSLIKKGLLTQKESADINKMVAQAVKKLNSPAIQAKIDAALKKIDAAHH